MTEENTADASRALLHFARRRHEKNPTTPVLDAVCDLAPGIREQADEIEAARRIPPQLVAQLATAGVFRMLVPRSHGGAQLDLVASMDVLELLAGADGSVGWTVWIGAASPLILRPVSPHVFDAIDADGPDVITGGSFTPLGVAEAVDGGYRVTGQWPFASGCQHCHWFFVHCAVDDGSDPPLRIMTVPATEIEIKDTGSVSGLCGTGSHDSIANDVVDVVTSGPVDTTELAEQLRDALETAGLPRPQVRV
ncbi:MAG: acyl-CoA dehydrogenase family protein, partial [Acidimicrobiales bacterium]